MPAIQRPLHAAHLHIPASACLSRSLSCGTQVKGNKGDQQYDVPPHAPDGAVVIWCRAFTVAFGAAKLS